MNWPSIINLVREGVSPLLEQCIRHACGPQPDGFGLPHPDWAEAVYLERLAGVQRSFDATTYYDSPFWREGSRAFAANGAMLRRVPRAFRARRLILLERPVPEQIRAHVEHLRAIRRVDSAQLEARVEREEYELLRIASRLSELVATTTHTGFEVRVVHDPDGREGVRFQAACPTFNPFDTELAVWDEETIDLYAGGRAGRVSGLTSWTADRQAPFPTVRAAAESYFHRLWEQGESAAGYFDTLRKALEEYRHVIDFVPNWVAHHEACLNGEEFDFKQREMEVTWGILDRFRPRAGGKRAKKYKSYLDIGTGPGRYLYRFRDLVAADGRIVGVDTDPACINRVKARFSRRGQQGETPDGRVSGVEANFLTHRFGDEKFDLVTMMLGTVSHLNFLPQNRNLDVAFRQIAAVLDRNGVVVVGGWDRRELEQKPGRLLGIYTGYDDLRLRRWTPALEDLQHAAHAHGLRYLDAQSRSVDRFYSVHVFTR